MFSLRPRTSSAQRHRARRIVILLRFVLWRVATSIAVVACPGMAFGADSSVAECRFPTQGVIAAPGLGGPGDTIGLHVVMGPALVASFSPQTRFYSRVTFEARQPPQLPQIGVEIVVGDARAWLPGYYESGTYADDFVAYVGPLSPGAYAVAPRVRLIDPASGALVDYCPGFLSSTILGIADVPATAEAAPVVEFYHQALDHYFMTQDDGEIRDLDSGLHPGWARTGESFLAYLPGKSGKRGRPVARYYGKPGTGIDSHFYAASVAENHAMAQRPDFRSQWQLEGVDVFEIATPVTLTGTCPAATLPVYRLWNQRADSNHRYTTDPNIRDVMLQRGYAPEGYGPDGVMLCAPSNNSAGD
jgi:hypothetical protein